MSRVHVDGRVDTCGVLLAAGGGRRMGQPKAALVLDGQTLLDRGLQTLADAGCTPLYAVVGASKPEASRAATSLDAEFVTNPDWETGMASSLRAGLAAASGQAAVVALVDQPGITAEAVRRLREAHRPGFAVVATFNGELRTPVLFDRSLWAEVGDAVTGDAGARHWLRRNPARVIPVACDDVADPTDLDLPEDLTRWERKCS
jgi:CTP:molybdopterin cytidylyltransferase MocA